MRHKVQLFSATLAVLAMTSIAAEPADDITPPSGYRNWFHVNTMIVDKATPLGFHRLVSLIIPQNSSSRLLLPEKPLCNQSRVSRHDHIGDQGDDHRGREELSDE